MKVTYASITMLAAIFCLLVIAGSAAAAEEETGTAYVPTAIGGKNVIMNPDISALIDLRAFTTDDDENEDADNLNVNEIEFAFQQYIYPDVRGDLIVALDSHEGELETEVEEAYVSFLDLPFGLQAEVGRQYMDFGRINQIHPHHWAFVDSPLVLENFFGEHNWYDDGVQASVLVPNPADIYVKASFGVWKGRELAHHHDEEEEHEHEEGEEHEEHDHEHEHGPIDWEDHVYTGRVVTSIPISDASDCGLGYSIAWDEGDNTTLHGIDAVFHYRWPMTQRKMKLQAEYFTASIDDPDVEPQGYYILGQVDLNKYWQFGARYDNSEFADNDMEEAESYAGFLTYYFSHSMYVRGEYRSTDFDEGEDENRFTLQFVWGMGPHSHRLED